MEHQLGRELPQFGLALFEVSGKLVAVSLEAALEGRGDLGSALDLLNGLLDLALEQLARLQERARL